MMNPFSTKFWTAGTIPFQFPDNNDNIKMLAERACRHRVCQIVGPHGSGKSTLLLNLARQYEQGGECVQYLLFNSRQRRLCESVAADSPIVLVDGFEQLCLRDRFRLRVTAKRLILTAHHPIWFVPILYRMEPQFAIFVQLARRMDSQLSEAYLREVFGRSGGNFRNAFFALYDVWEESQ